MPLKKSINDVWRKTDAYYAENFSSKDSISERLNKWRKINKLSLAQTAEVLFYYRLEHGFEKIPKDEADDDIILQKLESMNPYEVMNQLEARRREREEKFVQTRTQNLLHVYANWESINPSGLALGSLFCLKNIMRCDYDFLLCESNVPHKASSELKTLLGLNYSSIVKLSTLTKSFQTEHNESHTAVYEYAILSALDLLLSNNELMTYLSYFLTNSEVNKEAMITVEKPILNILSSDNIYYSEEETFNYDELSSAYLLTITSLLIGLEKSNILGEQPLHHLDTSMQINGIVADDTDTIGARIKKARLANKSTQMAIVNAIAEYYHTTQNYNIDKNNYLRTYQNWEHKGDTMTSRFGFDDLKALKYALGCDYEYLFGEINTLKKPSQTPSELLGLSNTVINMLKKCASENEANDSSYLTPANRVLTTIDLLLTDADLLLNLGLYLTDLPLLKTSDIETESTVLKPVKIFGWPLPNDVYYDNLFPGNSFKNILLPSICQSLLKLRDSYLTSLQ